MASRAALAFAVVATLAGCSGDDAFNPSVDLGVHPTDMGAVSDMGRCAILDVKAEIDPKTGMQKTTAPALLTAVAHGQGGVDPTWTVVRAGDNTGYTPTATDVSKLTVQFLAEEPGTWTFNVDFASGACRGSQSVTLGNPIGRKVLYRLRALPPESRNLPLTDTVVELIGGTPVVKDIALESGTLISGQLVSGGNGTPGEVRLIAKVGPDAVTTTNSLGAFTVAVQPLGSYNVLLIPESTALAPHLGAETQGAALGSADFVVGPGVTVTGSVTDSSATNLAGVRAVLRAGPLPSGAGTTDATGAFTLHAQAATNYTLSFGSDAWPQGSVADVPAVGGTTIAIQYTVARVAVGATVVASDGTTPVANARVSISSRPLGTIANVTVAGGAALAASGRVTRVVHTDAAGALPAMLLPAGTYDLIVEPPAPSTDGLTAITKVVGGAASWTLQLQTPITLAGTITGDKGQPVAAARVTGVEMVGLGAAPSTFTDASGHYALKVDRGTPVTVWVEPLGRDKLAGTRLLVPAGTTAADLALGPGLLVSGTVRTPGSQPLPAVEVEAFCFSCGSATPVATSITGADGIYNLYLPDPGELIVDGGATD